MNIHQGMFLLQRGGKRLIHVVIHVFLWEAKERNYHLLCGKQPNELPIT